MNYDENTREGRHLTPEERIALQAEEIKQLWQENEQLRAVLRKAKKEIQEAIDNYELTGEHEYDISEHLQQALAEIGKAIGGKEDV